MLIALLIHQTVNGVGGVWAPNSIDPNLLPVILISGQTVRHALFYTEVAELSTISTSAHDKRHVEMTASLHIIVLCHGVMRSVRL